MSVPRHEQRVARRLTPRAQRRDQAQAFEAEVLKLVDENVPILWKASVLAPGVLDDHAGLVNRPFEGQKSLLLKPTVEI
jgi:hypothetical protein